MASSSSSASALVAEEEEHMADDATARAWLAEAGFAEGDLRSAIKIDRFTMCPMGWASKNGKLGVCKWLHENGAAADVTKAMLGGWTAMYIACLNGHLSVCKWLFEVGAAADITKAANHGTTPLLLSFIQRNIYICHWLILNGALSDRNPGADSDHVDQDIVECDVQLLHRPAILAWAQAAVAANLSFRSTVVMGTFYPESGSTTDLLRRTLITTGNAANNADIIIRYIPDEDQQALMLQELRPVPALVRLRCQTGALELIADFLGVLHERKLRVVRELADVLVGMGVTVCARGIFPPRECSPGPP